MPTSLTAHASRTARGLVLAALCALGSACGRGADPALAPYASTPMIAGTGLGDLTLGTTTLSAFLERFKGGRIHAVVGDTFAFEIEFPDERLWFLFAGAGDCGDPAVQRVDGLETLRQSPVQYFDTHPGCAESPLISITAAAAPEQEDTFYRGTVGDDVGLYSLRERVLATFGETQDVRGLMLAGSASSDGLLEEFTYGEGLVVVVGESSDAPTRGRLVVTKLSVFLPAPPEG